MALIYKITMTVTTGSAIGCQRLFHGTLAHHVPSLGQGIDFNKCGGEFWAGIDLEGVRYFAGIAEQQLLFTGGQPGQAILAFDLPLATIESLEAQNSLWIYSHGYKFFPACSEALNEQMKNIEITYEE